MEGVFLGGKSRQETVQKHVNLCEKDMCYHCAIVVTTLGHIFPTLCSVTKHVKQQYDLKGGDKAIDPLPPPSNTGPHQSGFPFPFQFHTGPNFLASTPFAAHSTHI